MKVVPFTVPVPADATVHVQHDVLPQFYEHLHQHKEIQITWVKKGSGTLLAGNGMVQFGEGDCFVLGAGLPHIFKSDRAILKNAKAGPVEALSIFFDPKGQVEHLLKLPELSEVQRWILQAENGMAIPAKNASGIIACIKQVALARRSEKIAAFILLLDRLCHQEQVQALTGSYRMVSEAEGKRMNTIIQFTMKHYAEPITIGDLAKQTHLSPQAFCRYFKKHTRKSYITFLSEVRIHEACVQLRNTPAAGMATVAYATGFNSVTHFNRVFRKIKKASPGEYIKQWKGLRGE
jgi:AraC-like DNA-binding protein